METYWTTAGALRAVLAFINPNNTPKIAYDRDDLAEPLINKIIEAVGDKDGTQIITLTFNREDSDLQQQFNKILGAISEVFANIQK